MEQATKTETSNEEVVDKGKFTKYFTFKLGKEIYGIEVNQVREVNEFGNVYNIPRTTDTVKGVTNLRGEVIPVIDLSYLFYSRKGESTIMTSIAFIEVQYKSRTVLLGLMIDEVKSVSDIFHNTFESIPEFSTKIKPEYIKNISKVGDDFIILLNIENIINIDELSILEYD